MSEQLQTLNAQIIAAHEAHYKNAPEGWNGLIDCRNSSPNGNIIIIKLKCKLMYLFFHKR
jgi:hypothetical protein